MNMQYNPDFLNYRRVLSDNDKQQLSQIVTRFPLSDLLSQQRILSEMAMDFAYTSAKIEGNTYCREEAYSLLSEGITAGGKRFSDATTLINLHRAFMIVIDGNVEPLDFAYLCDLHHVLMNDLLPAAEQGQLRKSSVTIGGTSYTPISDPKRLRAEVDFLLDEAKKYDNPFEKAIYLHCNLAYLQLFQDGNKRTSRMVQTALLVQAGVLPLFFSDRLIRQYLSATVTYYETGCYDDYVTFVIENYHANIEKLTLF